ncbi:MAG: alpha/beta fold hydrolase [Chloroflexota bacterium]
MDASPQSALQQAANLLRSGNRQEARALLRQIIKQDPRNEQAWYMLGFAVDELDQQIYAFSQALRINPAHEKARKKLEALSALPEDINVTPAGPQVPVPPKMQAVPPVQPGGPESLPTPKGKPSKAARPAGVHRKKTARRSPNPILMWGGLVIVLLLGLAGALYLGYVLIIKNPAGMPAAISNVKLPTSTPAPAATATPTPTKVPPTPTPTTTRRTYTARFESAACNFRIPSGAQVECGTVIVPEDRDGNLARTIRLPVAIYHSKNATPETAPVIYLQGGPGQEAIQSMANYAYDNFIVPLLEKRNVIIFDQRGMGAANPSLDCPELKTLYLQYQLSTLSDADQLEGYKQALITCRDRLVLMGTNLGAYTTSASAADVKDILTALGYSQADLYGASYGTRLALTVMRDYPQIVHAAVLDSTVPLDAKLYNATAAKADNALNTLFQGCALDQACNAAYPGLETVFYEMFEQFNTTPATFEVTNAISQQPMTITVNGDGLMNSIFWGLFSSEVIPVLPKAIYDIHSGNYDYFRISYSNQETSYSTLSLGAMMSINCHEQVYATTPEELEADFAKFPKTQAFALSAVYGSGQAQFDICETWGAAPYDPYQSQALVSDLPTLILAGEYDPSTPVWFGKQAAQTLSNSYFFEFKRMGHTPSMSTYGACPRQVALAFLDHPTVKPDSSCLGTMQPHPFYSPYTGEEPILLTTFTNRDFHLAGLVPESWKDVGAGYYLRGANILDITQLGIQVAYTNQGIWLQWLTERFAGAGLDKEPVKENTYRSKNFSWNLYTSSFHGSPVDLAMASVGNRTIQVLLLSDGSERQALLENVFYPVVDSIEIIQ